MKSFNNLPGRISPLWTFSIGIIFWKACISMCFMASHYFPNDSCYCRLFGFFFSRSYDDYLIRLRYACLWVFPGGAVVKNLPANAGDARDGGSIPGMGRSPGEGNDNLFQYSYLENPMGRGTWWATLPGVTKSQTWLTWHTLVFVMLLQIDFNLIYLLMYMILSLFIKAGWHKERKRILMYPDHLFVSSC